MNLSMNSFSLQKYRSFVVPTAVMSNLRENHLGLRLHKRVVLGTLFLDVGVTIQKTVIFLTRAKADFREESAGCL